MQNVFKSGTTSTNGSIYKGNFTIGVEPAFGYGPTATTGFWNGITPATNGYTIYQHKSANGPSIFTAANDSTLISTLQLMGSTGSTVSNVLDWALQQANIMVANIDYPETLPSLTTRFTFFDAGYVSSYPRQNTVWRDLSTNARNGTLTNGPTYDSANQGSIVFDGTNDFVSYSQFGFAAGVTFNFWVKPPSTLKSNINTLWANSAAGSSTSGVRLFYNTFGTSDGNIAIETGDGTQSGSVYSINSGATITPNVWQNITFVLNKTAGTGLIYKNGSVVAGGPILTTYGSGQGTAYLGVMTNLYYMSANLAVFQSFTVEMTAAQVLTNYNAYKSRFGL